MPKVFFLAIFFLVYIPPAHADMLEAKPPTQSPPVYGYEIVATYDHNPESFTQGLAYDNGFLYEGTGKYGRSRVIRMSLEGSNYEIRQLPKHLFGEGITVYSDIIVQLTWKAGIGIVWDKESLQIKRLFKYSGEGWGVTHNGTWLIMSDGSATLSFLDPLTFSVHHRLPVFDINGPVQQLNELEYIKGEIWANIWRDNRIARIDPKSGEVTGWIDFSPLVDMMAPASADNVLNGIAYDKENDRIFVTGKRWDKLFEIKIVEKKK